MNKFKHLVSGLADAASADRRELDSEVAERLLSRCFKHQADFVLDRSRRKSALCPRRSGKSFACLVLMCRTGLLKPNSVIEYICLTRGQAKKNLWRHLKAFNDEFELGLKFHETDIRATFPNGTIIEFMGAETRQEIEKFRGQSFDLIVVDEGKSFQFDILEELIEEVLSPALSDRFGVLAMIGTPGNVLAGPFYECTSAYDPTDPTQAGRYQKPRAWDLRDTFKNNKWRWNWSFHSWHTKHNTAMPHIWEDALAQKDNRGILDNDPAWLREWMGQWCPSESLMVYAFSTELNIYEGTLPEGHEWHYLLGLDLGFNDSTAIVVAAYSDTHDKCYQVYDWKSPHLTVDAIDKEVRKVIKKFPEFDAMIADTGGLGKTIIATLQERGLGFEAAEKRDKLDHIEIINSDLRTGKIKLLYDGHLAAEMKLLQWSDKNFKKENKGTDNHCCDAFLYLIRYAYHHFWEPSTIKPAEGTADWQAEWDEQELEGMLRRHNNRNQTTELDQVFDSFKLDDEWIH